MICPADYFDIEETAFSGLFDKLECVWEVPAAIKPFIEDHIRPNLAPLKAKYSDFVDRTVVLYQDRLVEQGFKLIPGDVNKGQFKVEIDGQEAPGAVVIYGGACLPDEAVELGPGVVVETGAVIKGPTIIGPLTEVRQGAYVRGSCLVAERCVVGHVTEVKNAIFLEEAKAGHFAYVGDSALGHRANLGAGTKLANLKISSGPIYLRDGGHLYKITRRKFGAIIGDDCELGCNTVTSPGCLLGPRSLATPNATLPSGIHKPRSLFKTI